METLLPLAAVAVAFTATYFFCIRPMRRGHCAMGRAPQQEGERLQDLEHELRAAREEVQELRRQQARSAGAAGTS
ncbi:hypothetical protein [Nocardiopsis tropica]|uniref:Uncharacterized protein n=1 Tax=Nocardiopsis tropica TaxID=109330 RepID=A0ABU7KK70_9ACTN|nr:hypothetical protein [Nocardiopsis umidischolae]MEE2049682.1 hypothetical protein [Nocardiopsis umidischolae]